MNTNNIINRQSLLFAEAEIFDGAGTSTAKPTAPARLSVDLPILVTLIQKLGIDRTQYPNHRVKQLREVLAEKFSACEDKAKFDVEKAIREYYESDPVAIAAEKAKKEAEAAARKAEREAKQKAREREIAEFFGEEI